MSKNLKIILIVIVLVVLVGIAIWFISKNDVDYIIIKDGYSSYKSKIISNYQEYIEFVDYIDSQNKAYGNEYNFNSNKYNERYFDNKSLAIINIITGSGMDKLNNIDISITGNLLVCKADINYATGIVTDDINGKLLLIEIDKSVTEFKIEKWYINFEV